MPAGAQSENTALSFEVGDLAAEVKTLESHGVRFQDFEADGIKTVVLCLHEAPPPAISPLVAPLPATRHPGYGLGAQRNVPKL